MRLDGKVALVTGAARRLGAAMVRALAADGADVLVHFHRSAEEAERVVREVRLLGRRAEAISADVRDPDAVAAVFARLDAAFGRLDLLVNSASCFERVAFDALDEGAWARSLDTNLSGPFRFARHAAARMRSRGGLIVNLVDESGLRLWRGYLAHSVSKAGLISLTHGLARELAPTIRVNAICPGAVLWPEDAQPRAKARLLARVPLGREGHPDDVVKALRYLVEAEYVTGEVLVLDGGRAIAW